jgi:GDP/UDP-N,N'-diacetylbacillosamine 2-epimerase (hydrolysing)
MNDGPRSLRLLAVSGTRADFGLWRPVAEAAETDPHVVFSLLVTGMHLDPRFGSTVDEVRSSGIPIAAEILFTAADDSRAAMAASLGDAISAFARFLDGQPPDWVLVLGDRGEQLAAAIVALHLGLPVAHLHGGERTLGAVDDAIRDMTSRVAHLHLVATLEAARRLERTGEQPWRIHVTGAPGLDGLAGHRSADAQLRTELGLPPDGPYLLVVLHPETVGDRDGLADLRAVLAGVAGSSLPALAIGPNADAGGRAMLDELRLPDARVAFRTSLPREDYLALLAGATAIVGNSSSGIIEAPLLGVPAVNIGDRQRGRTRGDNVIEVPADSDVVSAAISRAADPAFRAGLSHRSPYGDGQAAPRIVEAIIAQPIDARLLVKEVAE